MAEVGIQACTVCAFRSTTLVASCPRCGAAVETRRIEGTGVVWSHTLVHLPYGDHTAGYRLAYVDLDGGPRVLCRTDATASAVEVGDRVRVRRTDKGQNGTGEAGATTVQDDYTLEVIA